MKQFGIGQPVRRVEDRRFITGRGRYLDDLNRPRQAYAVMLRSPHAHARIRAVDTAAALTSPGVLAVFTGEDLARDGLGTIPCLSGVTNRDGSPSVMPPHPAIARDRVRHVGDTIAVVVADSLAAARDAAELIAVDYEPLSAAVDTEHALDPGQPLVWDEAPGNLSFDWEVGDGSAVAQAMTGARHRIVLELVNNRVVVNSMEPRGAIGEYDPGEDAYTLWSSTQGSHFLRNLLAESVFKIPENRIRVVTPDVGGGFGMKLFLYPEHVLVLWAAKKLGRTVKWTPERSDAFMTDTQGRDNLTRLELALDDELRFLALDVEILANMGAYLSNFAPEIPTISGAVMHSGVYAIPAIHVGVKGVFTNTVPVDAYRGAGRPEAAYAIERLIDYAARRLGVAPQELRRRKFIKPEAMPYLTPLGLNYDSGEFARNMDQALAAVDLAGFAGRRAEARARGRYRGLGHAVYIEQSGFPPDEFAELRFDPSGTLTILMGTQSSGQGHQTAYTQLAVERLGVTPEKVRVLQGDTAAISFGRGTGGSRSLPVGGASLAQAADKLITKGRRIAAHLFEAAEADVEFADGVFTVSGTDRRLGIEEVARAAFNPMQQAPGVEAGFAETGNYTPPQPTFPNGCHVCEVEIEPDTGHIEIVRYLVVDDFGTVINPLLLRGQVQGGVAQGVGQAMLERTVFDPESGQLLTGSLTDYCLPRADDLPPIEFAYNVVPCRTNPLGVKGAGEAGAIGAPPALVNAVVDALGELGIEHLDMPLTPQRLWAAIRAATGRKAA
ncbi:MAG: xanthine dehydrogenase family protein molybdopterin-binding subunit [Alphaproteobacteria bacterium]|nr:MAG: xanthine dehydrogenase family protein molybdopterin-binding subunit [Alphaproteobacteria bacterium]